MTISTIEGTARKVGDDINTDYIIPGKYLMNVLDPDELAKHVMEGVDPDFYQKMEPGDVIVAGDNFGCGSSREEAPAVIKHAGIGAVLAQSFARIFFRNAVNIGLPIIECRTEGINHGDRLKIDPEQDQIRNLDRDKKISISPLPSAMRQILSDGGLVKHLNKHGSFALEKRS
ncbi:MAG: 3-isopropylmalate dehydratase small subunit [Candidatus Bipolaricaulota bacterium]